MDLSESGHNETKSIAMLHNVCVVRVVEWLIGFRSRERVGRSEEKEATVD